MSFRQLSLRSIAIASLTVSLAVSAAGCRDSKSKPRRGSQTELAALPYLAATPIAKADLGKRGVTIFDESRAASGLNVYCSEKNDWFELRDMRGTAHHRVKVPGPCKLVEVHDSGFLVLHAMPKVRRWEAMSRIDFDGAIRWTQTGRFHHDFDVVGDEVYVLAGANAEIEHEGEPLLVLDNLISVLDLATGKPLRQWSLRPALLPQVSDEALDELAEATRKGSAGKGDADLFHVNTLEVLRSDTPIGDTGDVLIAARHLDLVGVIDRDGERLRWQADLDLEGPHHPQLLASGNVLVFDNGRSRKWSRVLEIDPRSGRVLWSYEDRVEPVFFSATRGSVQALPSGNLLVAESDRGRWFELTRDKDIVWEYWTEDSQHETGGEFMRHATYRTQRLFADAATHPAYQRIWKAAAAAGH